jgi:hypothetical protein
VCRVGAAGQSLFIILLFLLRGQLVPEKLVVVSNFGGKMMLSTQQEEDQNDLME